MSAGWPEYGRLQVSDASNPALRVGADSLYSGSDSSSGTAESD